MRYDPETGEGSVFFDMTAADAEDAIDGIKVDRDGQPLRLRAGRHLGALAGRRAPGHARSCPKPPHNLAWGDVDGRTLYVTALTSVYRLRLEIPGIRPE